MDENNASLLGEHLKGLDRLHHIVAVLRGEQGCPWDKRQSPTSLKKYLLEECRELAEAIDKGDESEIRDEIGDVFFILAMLTALFNEQQKFTVDDVFESIVAKMIRRHPHVFAGAAYANEQELRDQWARIKLQEKQLPPSRP